ncbi:MAG TPA: DUF1549 domain-containing protein [Gemmataceae bacterium]|nr:DUF1549 domain-containing protein [Gemmataceae bacterium]
MYRPSLLLLGFSLAVVHLQASEPSAQVIDRLLASAWVRDKVQPAALSDDAEFVRRIYLDLIGRIPTREEAQRFFNNRDTRKRSRLIDDLLTGGEFAQHWRENLNALFMGRPPFAGNPEWRAWLEASLRHHKKWDEMAREMLRARADKPAAAGASQFLLSRFAQGDSGLDLVARDVSRFFFGVDIQCARCHKHPNVRQWKQESYWGMAAYFKRSYPLTVKGKLYVAERAAGEVEYVRKGKTTTARPMFLTGEKLTEPAPVAKRPAKAKAPAAAPGVPREDPADYLVPPEAAQQKTRVPVPKFSRREQFVETAVNGKNPFFKRAAVNYIWSQLMGRGLVEPVDQMHDGNPPCHPQLLRCLADDFVAHDFDLRYLIRTITNSTAYQLSSRYPQKCVRPAEEAFACGMVRPLTPHQLAISLMVAAGYYDAFRAAADVATRSNPDLLRAKFEAQHAGALAGLVKDLDSGTTPYQPCIREALFQTNAAAFEDFIARGGLAKRLAAVKDDAALVDEACHCVLSRPPGTAEAERLLRYLQARRQRRAAACGQIVWALLSSPEFRFNH